MSQRRRILILGAAGRDFHDFNTVFRADPEVEVVAFTAAQIPDIAGRRYPAELAGPLYPEGIPIREESEMEAIIAESGVEEVVFSYSDLSHEAVMHLASRACAAGAGFRLLGAEATMLESTRPVVAVTAVRTGCGKSQTSRHVAAILKAMGHRVAVVRHPMPYGDLARQAVQRFADEEDLFEQDCTIEEREEYEPHIEAGHLVFAGVDYARILEAAEEEADVVLWDGGNNDLPFFRPDLWITIVDPHRPGHERRYWPGEANVRAADVILINKIDSADGTGIEDVMTGARALNPDAELVLAASPLFVDDPEAIRGKRVLVVEDGPTLTHGEMAYGAGVIAARRYGAAEIVDPRPFAVASIAETYARYPSTGSVLPAMGYGEAQVRDLEATIRRVPCDLVLIATPIDLRRLVDFPQPAQRVRYELQVVGEPTLEALIRARLG
ncbi:MAG: GTPase [Caldilineae bacterium]|nr:GTPase [Chloroflexota bacterium]MCB9175579.1 GTPase [Caldilineae bacterium]